MIKLICRLEQAVRSSGMTDRLTLRCRNCARLVPAYGNLCLILLLLSLVRPVVADDPNADSSTWVTSIAPAQSAGQFVAGTANSLLLREAAVVSFSADAPQKLTTLYSHPAAVWCVATTKDGSTVASVDYRGNLVTFDMASKMATKHENAFERWCQSMALSPDDQFVVAGNEAGKVMAWEIKSDKVTKSVELDGHAVTDLEFAPDGKTIAASDGDGHVHLLQWPSLESIGKIEVSDQPAWTVAFVENGNALLVGSGDHNLHRCAAKPEAKSESIAKGTDWITEIAISPGGEHAASEVGGRVMFPSGGNVDAMEAKSGVWALHWNGDGQLLVGTRKHGVVVAGRSWKWAEPSVDSQVPADEPEHAPADEPEHAPTDEPEAEPADE